MADPKCFAQHCGPWMIEPMRFSMLVQAVQAGQLKPQDHDDSEPLSTHVGNGLAVVPIQGQITKRGSSFGGAGSVGLRNEVRSLMSNPDVRGIMLQIDSPGGTAAGTPEFADVVFDARKSSAKPIHAFADDLMASAAAFVGLQAERVSVNRSGEVGSFGTVAMLTDTSDMAAAMGAKVHVVSTGPYKGAFAPGAPITDEHLEYAAELVDNVNQGFVEGVGRARFGATNAAKSKDLFYGDEGGKVFSSGRALELGIVDAVETLDQAMRALSSEARQYERDREAASKRRERKIRMAEF